MRFIQYLRTLGRNLLASPNLREAYRAATVSFRLGARERLPGICVKTSAQISARPPAEAGLKQSVTGTGREELLCRGAGRCQDPIGIGADAPSSAWFRVGS
jgi:hypothetical protein